MFGHWPNPEGQEDGYSAIHVVSLETRLVTDLPNSKGLWTARWSPDGHSVAALTIASGQLRLFQFSTGKWRAITSPRIGNPTWSHEGDYIYFDNIWGDRAMYRARVSDGKVERIVSLEGSGAETPWGSGLTPDDSPLITRDIGFTEVYALDWEAP